MAKVLSAISLDSPASPVSTGAGSSFTFAGTPTLTGGGGAQRYDLRWEVNPGSGYVPITGATGLSTADANPLVNTNSQSQSSITVTCSQAGSYTIRMAGAPTSGGSYSIFSPTQTVTVTLAGITGSLGAAEAGSDSASLTGTVSSQGTLTAQESGTDGFAGTGSVESNERNATLAATESGNDTAALAGNVPASGSLGTTDTPDSGTISGTVPVNGAATANEAGRDTASIMGSAAGGNPPPQARRRGAFSMTLSSNLSLR